MRSAVAPPSPRLRRVTAGTGTRMAALAAAAVLGLVLCSAASVQASDEPEQFDHLETGFPLTGPHRLVQCETCHRRAVFAGTPVECEGCHMLGRIAVTVKPGKHVPAGNRCDDCHTPYAWVPARFEHATVSAPCAACHNGVTAKGKAANHIPVGNTCGDCHGTRRWTPTAFSHSLTTLPCIACHNGSAATGQPANHIPAPSTCDLCHATNRWKPTRFTHDLTSLPCVTCHNNRNVDGKPKDHIPAPDTCESCHTTDAWKPLGFSP